MVEPFDLDAALQEARRSTRTTMWTVAIGVPLLTVAVVLSVWFAASAREASRDSFNATAVQLATQERNACITERRTEQIAAQGEESAALGRALIAAFIADDTDLALAEAVRFEAAADRQDDAAASLSPDVVDEPPPLGCGPPILTIDDLKENP